MGGGVAITYGALTDKLTDKGHSVRVISPRLGNTEYGTTNLYMGFPVMLVNYTNFKFLSDNFDDSDVVICPDNNLLMFLIFMSHWKGKPLISSTHTNFKVYTFNTYMASIYIFVYIYIYMLTYVHHHYLGTTGGWQLGFQTYLCSRS